nr:hypothetical protein [Actinomadura sp. J1-007]
MPRGPSGRQEAGQHGAPVVVAGREQFHERRRSVQNDRVAPAHPPFGRAFPVSLDRVLVARREGQERSLGEPAEDGPADAGVQLARAHRPRNEVEQLRSHGPVVAEQPFVRLGGAFHQEVGEGAGRDVPPVGRERERRDQQGGQVEAFVRGRRRVHHARHLGPGRVRRTGCPGRLGRLGQGPADLPGGTGAFLNGSVGQQLGRRPPVGVGGPPHRPADRDPSAGPLLGGQDADVALNIDLDAFESGQGEHERGADLAEARAHERDGGLVPQRQPYDGREPVRDPGRVGPRQRERQAQQRHLPTPPRELVRKGRDPGDQPTGRLHRPPDPHHPGRIRRTGRGCRLGLGRGDGRDRGVVGDGDDGGEAHAETSDGARVVALGGGAEG